MNTFYYARIERRNFGDLLSDDGLSRLNTAMTSDYNAIRFPDANAVLAVWSHNPNESKQLPQLLICQNGTENDWAAWITTFAAKIRPFSAYMRLLTESSLSKITSTIRTSALDSLTWPAAGLILGEILAASGLPDKALDTLQATACASTLSFALFRAAAIYDDFEEWNQLVDAWESARRMTKQRDRPVDSASVARVCACVLETRGDRGVNKFLNRSDIDVRATCYDLIRSPGRAPSQLMKISQFDEAEAMMHGPRENRVVAFERFVSRIGSVSTPDSELMPLAIGYLASRIAPGTIRHSSILGPITYRYPTAVLWYGFCAGFGDVDYNMLDVVGRRGVDLPAGARRVARELFRMESILGSPTYDIGFSELVALSRTGGNPLEGLITMTQTSATIELAPFVWTVVNVSSKQTAEVPVRAARERTALATLGKQIDILRQTYEEIISGDTSPHEGEQRSLLTQRRRKK